MSKQKYITGSELAERWGRPLFEIIALVCKDYLNPLNEVGATIIGERYILSSEFDKYEDFKNKVKTLIDHFRDIDPECEKVYKKHYYKIPENKPTNSILAFPTVPSKGHEHLRLGRFVRPDYTDTSDTLLNIFKNCRFFMDDILKFESEYEGYKPKTPKQEVTKESEKEEIIRLRQSHSINKGKAKEIRIAILRDDHRFPYSDISQLLGFSHEDENEASARLRTRASEGRKLRKQYNE